MQKFIKYSELQAANSPAKIAKLNVLETGIHLATADIDVEYAATATLTKTLKEKKKVCYKCMSSRKNVVQCWQQLLPKYKKEVN